jgi:hybrid cluster-associated redox disulfide protein
MKKIKITKDMNIVEILNKKPKAAQILLKHGFHCLGCQAANFESLDQGAVAHGLSKEKIKKLIEEINKS